MACGSAATAFTTSPWAYNGKLFCLSEEGQTFVIATGEEFRLLHVNELDDMAQASPALVGDAQFSASRALATQYGMSQGFDVSLLGFVPSFTSQVVSQCPAFTISDVAGTANSDR